MSDLVPWQPDGAVTRHARGAARAISRSKSLSQMRQARIADEADVAVEKVEQVSLTAVNAMFAVARVNGVLKQLEQQSPELSGRLARLADYHELAVAQNVEDLRRDLRRR